MQGPSFLDGIAPVIVGNCRHVMSEVSLAEILKHREQSNWAEALACCVQICEAVGTAPGGSLDESRIFFDATGSVNVKGTGEGSAHDAVHFISRLLRGWLDGKAYPTPLKVILLRAGDVPPGYESAAELGAVLAGYERSDRLPLVKEAYRRARGSAQVEWRIADVEPAVGRTRDSRQLHSSSRILEQLRTVPPPRGFVNEGEAALAAARRRMPPRPSRSAVVLGYLEGTARQFPGFARRVSAAVLVFLRWLGRFFRRIGTLLPRHRLRLLVRPVILTLVVVTAAAVAFAGVRWVASRVRNAEPLDLQGLLPAFEPPPFGGRARTESIELPSRRSRAAAPSSSQPASAGAPAAPRTRPSPEANAPTGAPAGRGPSVAEPPVVETSAPVAEVPAATAPAVAPTTLRAAAPPASVVYSVADRGVTPPVQVYPLFSADAYRPRPTATPIRIVINEEGRVESASIARRPVDMREAVASTLHLEAAKAWRFEPARKDGVPVKYERVIWLASR